MKYLKIIILTIMTITTLKAELGYNPYHLKGTWVENYMNTKSLAVYSADYLDPETDADTLTALQNTRIVDTAKLDNAITVYNDSTLMNYDISYTLNPTASGNEYMKVIPNTIQNNTVFLYFHGGGFVASNHGSGQCMALSAYFGSVCISLGYDLAPDENRYGTSIVNASNDLDTILTDLNIDRTNVIITGISAGGGMVGNVYRRLRLDGKQINFKGLWSWSGWWDLRDLGDSRNTYNNADTVISYKGQLEQNAKNWLGSGGSDYYGSPITQDFVGMPKTMFAYGIKETLSSDAIRAYQKALEAGVNAKLYGVDGYSHNGFGETLQQNSINHFKVADKFFGITQ